MEKRIELGYFPPPPPHTPGDLLQGMLGYHLQCMLGNPTPSHREQNDRCKNITLPQTSFAGGNKYCSEWVQHTCRIFMSVVEVFRVCLVRGLRVKCGEDNGISRQVTADYNTSTMRLELKFSVRSFHFQGGEINHPTQILSFP